MWHPVPESTPWVEWHLVLQNPKPVVLWNFLTLWLIVAWFNLSPYKKNPSFKIPGSSRTCTEERFAFSHVDLPGELILQGGLHTETAPGSHVHFSQSSLGCLVLVHLQTAFSDLWNFFGIMKVPAHIPQFWLRMWLGSRSWPGSSCNVSLPCDRPVQIELIALEFPLACHIGRLAPGLSLLSFRMQAKPKTQTRG